MQQKNATLTSKQVKAIESLLTSKSKSEACERAGINRSTLHRYFENLDFVQAYREAKLEALGHGVGRLQSSVNEAVTVLLDLLHDNELHPSVRVQVAKVILDSAFKGTEFIELERLEEDIQLLKENQDGKD